MKDLFFGALGRTDNHGGSRMFSTPNTVRIDPEYSIDININRNFVTCSLDGRLWAFGSGTTYVLFAFTWNEETSQLEQIAYLNFRGERIIARGLDWLLTARTLIFISDDEPYINTANLFEGTGRFLFSILRSSITTQAWGIGNNGNSEGWGFFNKNNVAGFEQCYSFLSSAGDWYITPNFLVRKDFESSYNSMRLLRPLIPLEFNGTNTPSYGIGYNVGSIQLVRRNNAIFGRGATNIGRVFLLPAVFSEDGKPLEFYLYISPDYVFSRPNDDDWPNMPIIVSQNGSIYGFASEQIDSLNNSFCHSSDKFFDAVNNEWKDYYGSIFFDCLNSSAAGIQDEGLTLFHDEITKLQCKALPQWIAPAGSISCITDSLICCSGEKFMFATNIARQFSRNITDIKILPLSAVTYSADNEHIRLSLGETSGSRKNISVNHFTSPELQSSILWSDIYKQAVNIRLLDILEQSFSGVINVGEYTLLSSGLRCNITRIINYAYQVHVEVPANSVSVGYGNASDGTPKDTDIVHNAFIEIFCIDPDTGMLDKNSFSIEYANILPTGEDNWNNAWDGYVYWPEGQKLYYPRSLGIQDGFLGVFSSYEECVDGYVVSGETTFSPLASIESIAPYSWDNGAGDISIKFLSLPNGSLDSLPEGCASAAYAVFSEKHTNTNFALHLPSLLNIDAQGKKTGFFAEASGFSYYEQHKDNSTLHFVVNNTNDKIAILRSEVFSNVFNFYDELQRSRLS